MTLSVVAVSRSRAIVLANGELDARTVERAKITSNDFIVCVDGGLRHALLHGLTPQLLFGDFDSATSTDLSNHRVSDVQRIGHPERKDASDLELALQELESRQYEEVVLLGISGGRTDHSLFNWMLPAVKEWSLAIRLIDSSSDAHSATPVRPFQATVESGVVMSLLPLTTVTGVSTDGLEYPLTSASISPGSTIGLSNVSCAANIGVRLASGVLLVIINY